MLNIQFTPVEYTERAKATHMWTRYKYGRRKFDEVFKVDWEQKRALRKVNLKSFIGEELEPIINREFSNRMVVALLKAGWSSWKIVNEKEEFSDDDYFNYADGLMRSKGIKP